MLTRGQTTHVAMASVGRDTRSSRVVWLIAYSISTSSSSSDTRRLIAPRLGVPLRVSSTCAPRAPARLGHTLRCPPRRHACVLRGPHAAHWTMPCVPAQSRCTREAGSRTGVSASRGRAKWGSGAVWNLYRWVATAAAFSGSPGSSCRESPPTAGRFAPRIQRSSSAWQIDTPRT